MREILFILIIFSLSLSTQSYSKLSNDLITIRGKVKQNNLNPLIQYFSNYDYQITNKKPNYLYDNIDDIFSKEIYDINEDIDYIPINRQLKNEELESHSSLVGGHQYVSGGAGEGKQHLTPNGNIGNIEEIKSDEDLPAYCDPPNPCPIGFENDDCDRRSYSEYTADFSKHYQDHQNCMCDDDHNECQKSTKNKKPEKFGGEK